MIVSEVLLLTALYFIPVYLGFKIYCIAQIFITSRQVKNLQNETASLKKEIERLKNCFAGSENSGITDSDIENICKENFFGTSETAEAQAGENISVQEHEEPQNKTAAFNEEIPDDKKQTGFETKSSPFSSFIKKQLSIESIVSKLGLLLLLIGIGYVFKLAHERGFIGKGGIVILGSLTGILFSALGFFVRRKKRIILSQVLLGGSISIFYLTAYAAYVRYGILGDFSAFIFLSIITVSAFVLAAVTSSVSVSVIGLLGSLFIPFIVGLDFFELTSFGLYIFTVSILSAIVYFLKRWRVLQFSSIISLMSVLSWLLLKTNLSETDAQLFLVLVIALWLINLIPDFYFCLAGKESAKDKIYSSLASIINYGFPIFLGFKLSAYNPVPEGSVYLLFTFMYSVLSYICIKKDNVKNLGYAYIFSALLSSYIAAVDMLKYDVRAAAVSGIALFLYWLWRRDRDYKLRNFAHAVFCAGYIMSAYALFLDNKYFPAARFALQSLFYFAPMFLIGFFQKDKFKKIFHTFLFQVYVLLSVFAIIFKIMKEYKFPVFSGYFGEREIILIYALVSVLIFGFYNFIHCKKEDWFYKKSFYAAPALVFLFCSLYGLSIFENRIEIRYERYELIIPIIIQFISAFGLLAISFFKNQNQRTCFAYRLGFYFLVIKISLLEFYYFALNFYWGIFLAGSFILAVEHFYKSKSESAATVKDISKFCLLIIIIVYYLMFYLPVAANYKSLQIEPLIVNIFNALILMRTIQSYKARRTLIFASATIAFVFLSFVNVYLPVRNNGILTLLWGGYSIASFIYFLKKNDKKLVYTSLVFIVIVSAKLILIDLGTVGILSKVLTSIVLGSALLILSYAVQPMMKKISAQEEDVKKSESE